MGLISWLMTGKGRNTWLGRAMDQNIGYLDESDGYSLAHLSKEEQDRRRAHNKRIDDLIDRSREKRDVS